MLNVPTWKIDAIRDKEELMYNKPDEATSLLIFKNKGLSFQFERLRACLNFEQGFV